MNKGLNFHFIYKNIKSNDNLTVGLEAAISIRTCNNSFIEVLSSKIYRGLKCKSELRN